MRPLFTRKPPPGLLSAEHLALVRERRVAVPGRRALAAAQRAQTAYRQFDLPEARRHWQQAAELAPGAADAYRALAALNVDPHLDRYLELLAHSADMLGTLAAKLDDQRLPELRYAPLLYTTAIVRGPDDARLAWARALLRRSNIEDAQMWVSTVGFGVQSACLRARIAFERGDNDQSLRQLQQITSKEYADDVCLLSAAALSRLGLLEAAAERLTSLADHPVAEYRLAARYHLAYVHEQFEQPQLARRELERVYAERADYADVGVRLGVDVGVVGQREAARDDAFDALAREFMSGRVADDPTLDDNR